MSSKLLSILACTSLALTGFAASNQHPEITMKKRKINVLDYAGDILKALPNGILLTTKAGETVNCMTIGWGTLGTNWSKPVFVAYVREGRFTKSMLDKNPEFTVSIPIGKFNRQIIGICGSKSGRNTDKIAEAGLTLVKPDVVAAPAIRELPLTLECRVMYAQKQDISLLDKELRDRMYPQNVDSTNTGGNRDAHISYFGEIVSAYILEE